MSHAHFPSHWATAPLEEVTQFVTSGSRGWGEHYSESGPLFLRVGNLDHDTVHIDLADSAHVQPPSGSEGLRTRIEEGDILISITAEVGMIGLAGPGLGEAYVNQHVALVRPLPSVYATGLAYSLLDPQGLQAVARKEQYGATKPGLSLIQVRRFEAPIPPSLELRRIVEAIESYFTRLDDAVATLERVERNLKRYRASVLKSAVEGRLVPTEAALAKQEGRDYEPASVLLERILTERRRRWSESGKKGKYQEPTPPDTTNLPPLPEGWCWASPGQLFQWSSGDFLPKKSQLGGEFPVYGGNGVNGMHSAWLVSTPTIVIGRVGAHCGNVHLTEGHAWITDNAIYASEVPEGAFLSYWTLAMSLQNLNANAGGTGQPYVNQKHLNDLVVPMPPRDEQIRICRATEELLAISDHVRSQLEINARRASRLRQSILKWAFEGKLADQDPEDEPAAALLERIKAERDTAKSTGTIRPKRVAGKKIRA
jgi:type I restriction enzyme S subunit